MWPKHRPAGVSAYVCVGRWAGVWAHRDGPAVVVCLGFVSVGVMAMDLERVIDRLRNRHEHGQN